MPFITCFTDTKIMCPDSKLEAGLRRLSESEARMFKDLCQLFEAAKTSNKIAIVYRGEQKSSLKKKLFHKREKYDAHKFFDRLFYVGEKAKGYFEQSKDELEKRSYMRSITDTSEETSEFIFRGLNQMMLQKLPRQSKEQKSLESFKQSNIELVNFFMDERNTSKFIESFRQLDSMDKREQVRDYYLYILHTYGIGKFSFFVSTSVNRYTATKFALKHEKEQRCSVVFHYFAPEPPSKYGVSLASSEFTRLTCEENGLPIFVSDLYPAENELAVKGALFPHFILGYCDLEFGYFVVNPHLFKQSEHHIPQIPFKGFLIDQTQFEPVITQTGYSGYVTRLQLPGNFYYTDKFVK